MFYIYIYGNKVTIHPGYDKKKNNNNNNNWIDMLKGGNLSLSLNTKPHIKACLCGQLVSFVAVCYNIYPINQKKFLSLSRSCLSRLTPNESGST